MSTTIADRPALAPAETWDERDARLAIQRREAERRKAQAIADGAPHEAGDETFVLAWLEDGRPIEVKACTRCGYFASNGDTCAQADQYVRMVRS